MHKRLSAALIAVALASIGATGVTSTASAAARHRHEVKAHAPLLQCAVFARGFSGIQIFGDAWTWWEQAVGKYARGLAPQPGSVLVFKPYGPMSHGHVAVVSQVLTDRIIQVTHANWSPIFGKRGQVEKDVTVVDVSKAGDWSQVKVWYDPIHDVGVKAYPTYGFVYKAATDALDAARKAVGGKADTKAGDLAVNEHLAAPAGTTAPDLPR